MPAQKRLLESTTPTPSPPPLAEEEKPDDSHQGSENNYENHTENTSDSDESPYSSDGEKDEFIVVKLAEVRKEVQCPICLGIIRKTRTVMECLHRFCRECIDKSMRLGNNECPACRTHCASRRSLRDDPNYDALISALYPDIDKYEEEELAFHDEEKARNKQIQASIAQTFRRQAEALGKKRASARVTAAFVRRQDNYRNLRGRRNHRVAEHHESDDEEGANGNGGSKDSSSADEQSPEIKSKRQKRWGAARSAQQASGATADGELLAWGRGGMRSNSRHGVHTWVGGKLTRNNRFSKLIHHLRSLSENNEVKISLTLISLLEEKVPSLKRPYLCCSPHSSVRHLCQYVAMQTSMEASAIEILMIKGCQNLNNTLSFSTLKPCHSDWQLLSEHLTLGEIHTNFTPYNLVLAYRPKAHDGEGAAGIFPWTEAVQI